jgi:hypothetical protein
MSHMMGSKIILKKLKNSKKLLKKKTKKKTEI